MNIFLSLIIVFIVAGHTGSAFTRGMFSRVLTYFTIALHPVALVPMLLLSLPLEAVALFFLSSALYYTVITLVAGRVMKSHTPSDAGGDEA